VFTDGFSLLLPSLEGSYKVSIFKRRQNVRRTPGINAVSGRRSLQYLKLSVC
jgi:hypothetical protein